MPNFIEKLKQMSVVTLKFNDFSKDVRVNDAGEREQFLILVLETPIPKVTSSISVYDPSTDRRANNFVTDVKEVRVTLKDIEATADQWTFEEKDDELTGQGSYSGDLFLDLSKAENVWLTSKKFSQASVEWRSGKRAERLKTLFSKIDSSK